MTANPSISWLFVICSDKTRNKRFVDKWINKPTAAKVKISYNKTFFAHLTTALTEKVLSFINLFSSYKQEGWMMKSSRFFATSKQNGWMWCNTKITIVSLIKIVNFCQLQWCFTESEFNYPQRIIQLKNFEHDELIG